jgi:hypothetical protein
MDFRILILKRSIAEVKNQPPPDDFILNYADFLRHRDIIKYYAFNPRVFHALLQLTIDLWSTTKRINRLSMLWSLKLFYQKGRFNKMAGNLGVAKGIRRRLPEETRNLMFILFRTIFEKPHHINSTQIEEARKICNHLLMHVTINSEHQKWLCDHAFKSAYILNRVLRYPENSPIISAWAVEHYFHPALRSRRAEHLSRILDADPLHVVEQKTLLDDFHHLNDLDRQAIRTFLYEKEANKLMLEDFSEFLPLRRESRISPDGFFEPSTPKPSTMEPELKLSRRFYDMFSYTVKVGDKYHMVPDFKRATPQFMEDLGKIHSLTMLWSIGYSRLDSKKQLELIKKYYQTEFFATAQRIASKTSNVKLLEWLLHLEEFTNQLEKKR